MSHLLRIEQLERDVKSLQECNNAAQTEIHLLRDKVIPALQKQLTELDRRTVRLIVLKDDGQVDYEAVKRMTAALLECVHSQNHST